VVGIALWFETFSSWVGPGMYLEDLFILPVYRRRGYGTSLMRSLATTCIEVGYGRLEWAVMKENTAAITFYESLGAADVRDWKLQRLDMRALTKLVG